MSEVSRATIVNHSKRLIARETGLDLSTFGLTRDGAWIRLAQRLKQSRRVEKVRLAV